MEKVYFRSSIPMWILATTVAMPSLTEVPDGCRDGRQEFCCLGANCGLDIDPDFHCHSVSAEGVQCWDRPGFDEDDFCERITGFNLFLGPNDNSSTVTAISCDAAGSAGARAGQLLDGVAGYNLFRTQIRKTAKPRLLRDIEAVAGGVSDGDGADDQDGEDDDSSASFTEMTTSLEVEDWTFRGISGETPGVRLGWRRQTETGQLFGVSASYQDADPDFGLSSRLLTAHVSYGHALGLNWTWSVSGTVSDFSGAVDDTLVGGTGLLGFSKYYPSGSVVSGGLVVQYLNTDVLSDNLGAAGFGLAYGFPIGRRLAFDLEGYAVSIWEGETGDDSFYTLAGMFSFYATPRFALTLGYRRLEGIDNLDSDSYTFGASTRWN